MKPIKKTLPAMAPSTPSSAKKNKRKSLEPKRLASTACELSAGPVPGVTQADRKRVRLDSTGSEDRSPTQSYNSESRSPSPGSPASKSSESSSPASKRASLSPMCLAPKKRFKFDALRDLEALNSESKAAEDAVKAEPEDKDTTEKSPFRPWSGSTEAGDTKPPVAAARPGIPAPYIPFLFPGLKDVPGVPGAPHPLQALLAQGVLDPRLLSQYLPPYLPLTKPRTEPAPSATPPPQEEPLSLVMVKKERPEARTSPVKQTPRPTFNVEALIQAQKALARPANQRPAMHILDPSEARKLTPVTPPHQPGARARNESGSTESSAEPGDSEKQKQRNYKNMTRERRVEANARERQRVHTITAAFDNLQAAIPTEEKDCKLSKLSVIKIATAYIMALSRMAGHDYTEDQSAPPVDEVISHCSEVIEKECRIKKRNGSP